MSVDVNAIKDVFLAALEKAAPAERVSFLDDACAGDASLRERVEALLQAHDQRDRLLDQGAAEHLGIEEAENTYMPDQPGDGVPLDFLSPSTKSGALGRLGHYEVLEVVGKGGMGIVFRAFDEKLHRIVAIKVLAPELARDSSARRRFVREAQATAAVTHDNVIAIHGVEDDGPIPYLIMQFVEGRTLQEKLGRTGPLPVKEILRLGIQMADGLAAAHRHGLVHRDIKPANILLENCIERVKITDFGLARAVDDASATQSGFIAGTPNYMSPEQANGKKADTRSDLFSLGSVLYALCAGHPPFRADSTMAVLRRVCDDTPRPVREINPDVPEWLQALIAELQAKDPAERVHSAKEVATLLGRRLTQLQKDGAFSDLEESAVNRLRPRRQQTKRRRIAGKILGTALVVVAVSIAGWFVYQSWFADRQDANTASPPPVEGPAAAPAPAAPPAPAQPVVLKPSHPLRDKHTKGVLAVAFSPDGKGLASGGIDRKIFLWDIATWQARGPLEGHTGDVTGLDFSPKDGRLASVSVGQEKSLVRLWDVTTAKPAGTLGAGQLGQRGMADVKYSPDGKTVACGGWSRTLFLLDVATGTELAIPDVYKTHLVRSLSFSSDGRQIATGGYGPALLWDTTTRKEIPTDVPLPDRMYPVFLPGGKGLAGWHYGEGRVMVCDLPSGEVRKYWRAHPQTIEGLAVSPDGRFLASVGKDVARVWSTEDFSEVATLIGHKGIVYAAAFSPDGTRLATGGLDDKTVYIWDLPAVCRVRK